MEGNLSRYIEAQASHYEQALSEIQSGRKRSHWMWYIFPQIKGLGSSSVSVYYSIENRKEAIDFLNHPVLGERLRQISTALLELEENDAHKVFGSPDDMKLQSSMTLFASVDPSVDSPFKKVLNKFFKGRSDDKTLQLMKE